MRLRSAAASTPTTAFTLSFLSLMISQSEGSVKIRDKRVSDDRIGFSGELELLVLYAGKNGEQPLYTMKSSLPMEDFIHMDGLEPDMEITLDANLEHLDCEIINDRKLSVKPKARINNTARLDFISFQIAAKRNFFRKAAKISKSACSWKTGNPPCFVWKKSGVMCGWKKRVQGRIL